MWQWKYQMDKSEIVKNVHDQIFFFLWNSNSGMMLLIAEVESDHGHVKMSNHHQFNILTVVMM